MAQIRRDGMSDGLTELLRRGLVFVRLDQVDLIATGNGTAKRR
jgi:hypothetical protein